MRGPRFALGCPSLRRDNSSNVLYSTEHLFSSADPTGAPYNPEATIQTTIQVISDLLKDAHIDVSRLLGIGVGINGTVDADNGVSCLAPHFGWHNISVAEPLKAHFGIPVYLENDARTLTIAEQWFGAGREVNHFVTVVIGYGIGSGLVTNKQLNRGASGGAGEFGHIVFQEDGPLCSCGKRGCLESLTSIPAVNHMIGEALASGELSMLAGKEPLTVEGIAQAAKAGDELAIRVLDTAGRYLGLGLASLVNVLNPELIVINGEAVAFGSAYLTPMETELRRNVFDGLADSLQIIVESAGNEVWARGAACIVLSSLFTSSEYQKIMPLT